MVLNKEQLFLTNAPQSRRTGPMMRTGPTSLKKLSFEVLSFRTEPSLWTWNLNGCESWDYRWIRTNMQAIHLDPPQNRRFFTYSGPPGWRSCEPGSPHCWRLSSCRSRRRPGWRPAGTGSALWPGRWEGGVRGNVTTSPRGGGIRRLPRRLGARLGRGPPPRCRWPTGGSSGELRREDNMWSHGNTAGSVCQDRLGGVLTRNYRPVFYYVTASFKKVSVFSETLMSGINNIMSSAQKLHKHTFSLIRNIWSLYVKKTINYTTNGIKKHMNHLGDGLGGRTTQINSAASLISAVTQVA